MELSILFLFRYWYVGRQTSKICPLQSIYMWLQIYNGCFSLFSKAYQSGGEMLLPCNHQFSAESLHPRAQIHPNTKLPLPSDVSIVFKCWLLVSDAHTNASNPNVLHPGPPKKLSHRFPLYWTFLTINLQEVTGRRKELCTHVYTHAPLSLAFTQMHREKVVFTTG